MNKRLAIWAGDIFDDRSGFGAKLQFFKPYCLEKLQFDKKQGIVIPIYSGFVATLHSYKLQAGHGAARQPFSAFG